MGLEYTLIKDWCGSRDALKASWLGSLGSGERLLLFSDGSLTLELGLQLGSRIDAQVRRTAACVLSEDDALYLGEAPGAPALERCAWLKAIGRNLVFARTVMPVERVDASLLKEISSGAGAPLGTVLCSRGIPIAKEKIGVGLVICPAAAEELSIGVETPLLAKRYVLYNREKTGEWMIKASVTEVFSPGIIAAPYIGN